MKTVRFLSVILCVLVVNLTYAQESKELKEVKFKARIGCNGCKTKIEKNMAFAKGVKSVEASVETKIVTIKYRTNKTTIEELEKELKKCGYGAELVTEKSTTEKQDEKEPDKSEHKGCIHMK